VVKSNEYVLEWWPRYRSVNIVYIVSGGDTGQWVWHRQLPNVVPGEKYSIEE
jgi:hypothetical protein